MSPLGWAERRQITVMFCDLVGSTRLSSHLDPEEYRAVLHTYRDACAGAVKRYDGHVGQQLGDGVMAYFGYPLAHEDDAERAVRAALEAAAAVSRIQGGKHPLIVRIGIHTGLTVVGGDADGLALGETPNLAARLQALAQPGTVLVSASTRRLIQGRFDLESLGTPSLKGIEQSLEIFRVLGELSATHTTSNAAPIAMVGRDQEAALLIDRWERAAEGDGQVVLIIGEPGIGSK